jgi:hypothetical protein
MLFPFRHSAHHKEAAMIRVMTGIPPKGTRLHPVAKTPCTHSRLVDDVLTKEGNKTGRLVCVECAAVFLDPMFTKLPPQKSS